MVWVIFIGIWMVVGRFFFLGIGVSGKFICVFNLLVYMEVEDGFIFVNVCLYFLREEFRFFSLL